jgi:hypothetical protein
MANSGVQPEKPSEAEPNTKREVKKEDSSSDSVSSSSDSSGDDETHGKRSRSSVTSKEDEDSSPPKKKHHRKSKKHTHAVARNKRAKKTKWASDEEINQGKDNLSYSLALIKISPPLAEVADEDEKKKIVLDTPKRTVSMGSTGSSSGK